MTMSRRRLVLLPCLAVAIITTTPSSFLYTFAFKSTSIKQPFISGSSSIGNIGNSGSSTGGDGSNSKTHASYRYRYRRRSPPTTTDSKSTSALSSSSRSPISIIHHRDSSCIVLHAAGADDTDNAQATDSPTMISLDDDNIGRRFSAAPTDRAEIIIFNNDDDDVTTTTTATSTTSTIITTANQAATSTVNERLLSEIQASLDKQKGVTTTSSSSKSREYFKEFRSTKTEEERQRSLEEARDLNGVNPLVCIGGAAFAWACAGALWVLTTYLGIFFASHPLDTDVYFVQRVAGVFRNVVVGLSSLASAFFGVVGVGVFLLGVRVGYGVITGELDPTPIKVPKMKEGGDGGEEFVLPDVWELMMGKKKRRR
ncbi:hypothetical protein ACHAWU_002560 [Discostella pseudostelligera]|uniref:Transmembrane protein n=1 Tax=Discostella pseudostelligera TaxID=259834 RepID=A0ABD3LZ44_9STRA